MIDDYTHFVYSLVLLFDEQIELFPGSSSIYTIYTHSENKVTSVCYHMSVQMRELRKRTPTECATCLFCKSNRGICKPRHNAQVRTMNAMNSVKLIQHPSGTLNRMRVELTADGGRRIPGRC